MAGFRRMNALLGATAAALLLTASPLLAATPALPPQAPLPRSAPRPPAAELPLPQTALRPPDKPTSPDKPASPAPDSTRPEAGKPPVPAALPRPAPAPPAMRACLARLLEAGAEVTEPPPPDPSTGCAIPGPLAVRALSPTVRVEPEAVMGCALAARLERFVAEAASPAAVRLFGSPVAAIGQASAYVCRPRHGSAKMSEHAFGNAVDIARFVLANGEAVEVKDYGDADPKRTAFLAEIRKAACGPFRTVLGPGADPDHATHLHLDLQPRKGKEAFCQ